MSFRVHQLSLEVIDHLRRIVPAIARHDRDLARQARRSASSMVLNIAEGARSDPGTQRSRYHSAAGSANETRAALELAARWGHVQTARVREALDLLDRVVAMLWRLTH